MRRLLLPALALAACLALTATATASNDCCWDWSSDPGQFDQNPGGGGLPGGPARPGAPAGWSHCTQTAHANCFLRQGRQIRRLNWHCIIPSNDPNGQAPVPPGQGYLCSEKGGPGVWWVTRFPTQQTNPSGGFPLLDVENPGTTGGIPTMSEWAMGIMCALFLLGGVWMLRRQKSVVAGS